MLNSHIYRLHLLSQSFIHFSSSAFPFACFTSTKQKKRETRTAEMSLPRLVLICLSVVQLCVGDQPVEEVIQARRFPMLGGWHERNPESAEVQEAAQHAVQLINTSPKYKKLFKLISVSSAESQVTNVIHFKINMILGRTKCLKSENQDLNNCSLSKKKLQCKVEVTFDPRNSRHNLLDDECIKLMTKV
ncbi:hypothetical protein OJAV_G00118080 [Oryzias javanicus]|uniref:Cystatin domain-containing protein n=1 Tax=Oryzias javanicus TaxID=123683 RepID=A0A3S2PFP4_ORYJA|nr:hypothetical protein OJAV_G00118080 [Oryzias javanicus]